MKNINIFLFYYSLIITIILFCILGIFAYFVATKLPNYLSKNPDLTIKEIKSDDTDLKNYFDKKFEILNTKIDSIGRRDFSVLGLTPIIGQIEAKDANLTEIPIYETASVKTNVVGSAKYGLSYPYFEKNESWYKIAEGWVEARWFNEVTP